MFRPRIIPVLLLRHNVLVKSKGFRDYRYIGDPINAVRIFNDLKADELAFFDIAATQEGRSVSLDVVKAIGEEANMPFAVGGGIRSLEDIRSLISAGAEKAVINTAAIDRPDFIREASDAFGSSTIMVCMDAKRDAAGDVRVWTRNGTRPTPFSPADYARRVEDAGAGEIIVQSIERDGMMTGYDIELIRTISMAVSIPVIALGGAGSLDHMRRAYTEGFANGLAAGSMFVFHGPRKGVLINYPDHAELSFP